MTRLDRRALLGAAALIAAPAFIGRARAEASEVRISKGYGMLYLPLFVMQERRLLERKAAEAGLGDVRVNWLTLDGGNVINDAMIAGQLDIAGTGAPGFITLWARGRGSPRTEVIGVTGMSTSSLVLNTNKPEIRRLADFTPRDKIAIPGVRTSLAAVVLQMAAAREFGPEHYARLDPFTVGLPHPEALQALLSGRTEITAHFASPPFSFIELDNPRIHTVVRASEVFGNISLDVVFGRKRFIDENPRLTAAFVAAMDEACELIRTDKSAAADIFSRASQVRVSPQDVARMLDDPDAIYSATPTGTMQFAEFMHRAGSIRVRPGSWSEMFIPQLHARAGS